MTVVATDVAVMGEESFSCIHQWWRKLWSYSSTVEESYPLGLALPHLTRVPGQAPERLFKSLF